MRKRGKAYIAHDNELNVAKNCILQSYCRYICTKISEEEASEIFACFRELVDWNLQSNNLYSSLHKNRNSLP